MKKFFLNLLSSFMGAWIALVLFCIVGFIVFIGIVGRLFARDSRLEQRNQEISKIAGEDPTSILVNETSRVLQRNPCQARLTPLAIRLE